MEGPCSFVFPHFQKILIQLIMFSLQFIFWKPVYIFRLAWESHNNRYALQILFVFVAGHLTSEHQQWAECEGSLTDFTCIYWPELISSPGYVRIGISIL